MKRIKFSPKTHRHTQRIVSWFFLTLIAILLIPPALAQQNSEFDPQTRPSESTTFPESVTPNSSGQHKSIWEAIWELLQSRKEPTLASRRELCPITPGLLEAKNVIWSDRPMFIWQGNVSSITIYLYDSFNAEREQQLLWSQTFTPQSPVGKFNYLAYTAEALKPGKSYDWEIVISSERRDRPLGGGLKPNRATRSGRANRYTFQVMASGERKRITADLRALETQVAAAGASEEEIALEKANYFAKKGLWSDALQQIYSTPNPSEDFIRNARDTLTYFCD